MLWVRKELEVSQTRRWMVGLHRLGLKNAGSAPINRATFGTSG